jgi:hypothetical protein
MTDFNISYDELKNILHFTNGFIAGGFALSAFLNNNIKTILISKTLPKYQDIDIFIRIPYTYEDNQIYNPSNYKFKLGYLPFELLAKKYIINILKSKNYIENIPKKDINEIEIEYKNCALSHFIKNINTFINKDTNRKIQIIFLYDCKIEDFLETFDLNICRLAFMYSYDKDELDFYHNINKYLNNYELNLIRNKEMYIYVSLYTLNLFSRIIKYINRGFKFIDKNNHSNLITSKYLMDIDDDDDISIRKIKNYINDNFSYYVMSYDNFCKIKNNLNTLD